MGEASLQWFNANVEFSSMKSYTKRKHDSVSRCEMAALHGSLFRPQIVEKLAQRGVDSGALKSYKY
ncbi:hypothetical protein J6590_000778 [Homalodisca vitripennis]|nr:hypothetical protein J6590_000778 [Homalodisca vitripennis]